jgi:hypothetical protein
MVSCLAFTPSGGSFIFIAAQGEVSGGRKICCEDSTLLITPLKPGPIRGEPGFFIFISTPLSYNLQPWNFQNQNQRSSSAWETH